MSDREPDRRGLYAAQAALRDARGIEAATAADLAAGEAAVSAAVARVEEFAALASREAVAWAEAVRRRTEFVRSEAEDRDRDAATKNLDGARRMVEEILRPAATAATTAAREASARRCNATA